ncbi:hypothetical protein DICPUDRAFT_74701 [Dictyostelium purpureum]|uniref:Metallo-beta-lactamase domain-containing protein n=1 Tax=Dictyostelium purpureum TaxID=5786 RepID=F0Z8H8_DICPU|nr:uncharacterized protein DICPUDRAFT_74701 [Dictyostelium purpureum]EGC39731.1 hypothetical protein DICPUDRAFT_74701 [Dictyostelium purpureum]|eukprot:XP_003283717.1 hypothetical protein DICPUDRAFT_74701 [Dictyostelium purpureum]
MKVSHGYQGSKSGTELTKEMYLNRNSLGEIEYNNNGEPSYQHNEFPILANYGSQRGLFDRNSSLWGGWVSRVIEEAVRIHKELTSKRSFGVHWGTFILSTEPLLEPPKLLIIECEKANIFNKNEFFTSKIGETAIIED